MQSVVDVLTRSDAAPPERVRRSVPPLVVHLTVVAAGLGLWAVSLSDVDLRRMTEWGLVSVLPWTYFAALVVLCAGFGLALVQRSSGSAALAAHTFAMVAVLHATVPLVYSTPRYSYVYKHIAVVRFIDTFGTVDRSVDIYHNWPGFFSAVAIVTRTTGIDPMDLANWADPFFALCGMLAVYVVARGLTADRRRVVATTWLYVVTSCVSQTYLAPQSLAFFLSLLVLGIVLRWLRPGYLDWSKLIFEAFDRPFKRLCRAVLRRMPLLRRLRLVPELDADIRVPPPTNDIRPAFAVAIALVLSAAVVVSHQLSPAFLILGLAVLFAFGRSRSWSVPVLVTVMMGLWLITTFAYVSVHFSLFSLDPADNIVGNVPLPGSIAHQVSGAAARVVTVVMIGLAALAWWTAPRHRRETFVWGLVVAPALVLLFQSYGGEAIYRVNMFALPWLCYLVSRLLTEPTTRRALRGTLVALVSTVSAFMFVVNYYGSDSFNYIRPEEVRASEWFETRTPPDSVLGYVSGNWPTPVTADYTTHLNADGNWGAGIYSDDRFSGYIGRHISPSDVPSILETMRDMAGGRPLYVGIGPAQITYVEENGLAPVGDMAPLVRALQDDPALRVVYSDGDASVFEVLPQPPPPAPPAPAPPQQGQVPAQQGQVPAQQAPVPPGQP